MEEISPPQIVCLVCQANDDTKQTVLYITIPEFHEMMTGNSNASKFPYRNSFALIVGINEYKFASPLKYAVSDAEAVADALKNNFGFPKENVRTLCDKAATRNGILKAFLDFTQDKTETNDRLLFFFAGHGTTVGSRRGEVGFLVPHEGQSDSLSTLIRWDEFTRNADLISAKHVLFVMDACYGGLAITRSISPGAMRFLKDMLRRPARQVITAGKADEVVADAGGPRSGHSIFTGHFLDALDGRAKSSEGLVTANGVMAYVYENVGRDKNSQQTPHYGYLDGDGDFIFNPPLEASIDKDLKTQDDVLISIPAAQSSTKMNMTIIDDAKKFLAAEGLRIKLHDLVAQETRRVMSLTSEDHFEVSGSWSTEEFVERVVKYDEITSDLASIESLIGYWASGVHADIVSMAPKRIADRCTRSSGITGWLALRWYPVWILTYCGGIGAIAAKEYSNLMKLLLAEAPGGEDYRKRSSLSVALVSGLNNCSDSFKSLPGHERNYVPVSEYLFKQLQPKFDDLLFLGTDYEACFDRFEVFLSLACEDQEDDFCRFGGRFAWKFARGQEGSPFHRIMKEAETHKDSWPPLRSGMFGGSYERFKIAADRIAEVVPKLGYC